MDLLDRLLGHDRWTTGRFLALSRDLTDAQLDHRFDIGHRTIRDTFAHMIGALNFWNQLMRGAPIPGESDDRSIAGITSDYERSFATFATFARQVRDANRFDDTFVDDEGGHLTFGSTFIHVVLHDAQHRGEVLHMLERLGVPDLPEGNPLEWEIITQGC
jgi:uncharacterized damage-inducible protein DinB